MNVDPVGPDAFDLVDLYRIKIGSPAKFYATTGDGSDAFLIADPVLYLFDSAGRAVVMNDDADGSQSAILGLPMGYGAGFYFPRDLVRRRRSRPTALDPLFDVFGTGGVLSANALGGWQGDPLTPNFDIPGVVRHRPQGVPEPGSLSAARAGDCSAPRTTRRALANI